MTPVSGTIDTIVCTPGRENGLLTISLTDSQVFLCPSREAVFVADGREWAAHKVFEWLLSLDAPVKAVLHPDDHRYGAVIRIEFSTEDNA